MTKYECIKGLVVPELEDYEGMETGNDFIVNVGTIWLQEDKDSPMLTQENGNWLDIDEQTLDEHFIEVPLYKTEG
ncbi:hypothetical protein [Alkalibacillus almallahensis]|uniref:hypothetical protein n=1 Tax=Alkalibacillus almallahensis TaxID=1379154 RepID=UPI00141E1502|nr:hypothetical protein [Alkalibacillus almallahensis]NIK12850.1 hypothetical protein [Alkalibacillus almallahensis]